MGNILGDNIGDIIGFIGGDTRTLESSPYRFSYAAALYFPPLGHETEVGLNKPNEGETGGGGEMA